MSIFHTLRISNPRFEHDHLRLVTVKSKALKRRGDLTLFVPPSCPTNVPLITLLHGVYGSHWSWSLGGGAHLTANRLIKAGKIQPVVLVMPSDGLWGDGSGYVPHTEGDYEQWIIDEVPAAAMEVVPAVTPASPRFIAGLSMGGFGALRLGGTYADRYAGISAHSAITEFEQLAQFIEEPLSAFQVPDAPVSPANVLAQCEIPLRFDCGTDDPLLQANRALHHALKAAGRAHIYEEFAGGHEWSYWEQHIEDTLLFFEHIHASQRRT